MRRACVPLTCDVTMMMRRQCALFLCETDRTKLQRHESRCRVDLAAEASGLRYCPHRAEGAFEMGSSRPPSFAMERDNIIITIFVWVQAAEIRPPPWAANEARRSHVSGDRCRDDRQGVSKVTRHLREVSRPTQRGRRHLPSLVQSRRIARAMTLTANGLYDQPEAAWLPSLLSYVLY